MEALLAVTFLGYMIAAAAFVAALYDAQWKRWAFSSLAVGWGAQTAWLVREGFQRGLWPITTMYDWTAGFVWLSIVAFVFYQRLRPTWPLGGFLMPVVVVVWLGGQVLPRTPGTSTVLVSSIASMAAYVAFLIAAVFSVMYFEKERELKWKKVRVFYYQLPSLDVMDMVSARLVWLGLALLTMALGAGFLVPTGSRMGLRAVSTVIVWVIYALYVALRQWGWQGHRAAVYLMLAFVLILVDVFLVGSLTHGAFY